MDFMLTDKQRVLRKAVIDFAQSELNDNLAERDRLADFYMSGWKKCAEFGLLGLPLPIEFGGSGADALTLMIAMEGLGFGCRDNGFVFAITNHIVSCTMPILRWGESAQKSRYLPCLAKAKLIGALAMTEPQSGSDPLSLQTTARRSGRGYILNGCKKFITNGPVADVFVLFAKTAQGEGLKDLSAFIVEREFDGVSAGENLDKMGLRTASMCEIRLEDCKVPASNLLGGEGNGFMVFSSAAEWERCYLSASNIGAMKRQLEACLAYANDRKQFGRPIGRFQAVAHKLADMRTDIELAELLLHKIGWLRENHKPAFLESAMAKLFTSESYIRSSLSALQIHGAFGYMTDSGVERQVRDSLASTIYAGTSEIQRDIIARWIGLDSQQQGLS